MSALSVVSVTLSDPSNLVIAWLVGGRIRARLLARFTQVELVARLNVPDSEAFGQLKVKTRNNKYQVKLVKSKRKNPKSTK